MNKIIFHLVLVVVVFISAKTWALAGGYDQGNGGDMCEARFIEIREDLNNWIDQDGAQKIRLPVNISIADYVTNMKAAMKNSRIICVDDVLKLGQAEKTCLNQSLAGSETSVITCNAKRFLETPPAAQYTLVHHEYAGVAGFESNETEESRYDLSNQITGFLQNAPSEKLVVKDRSHVQDFSLTCNAPFQPSTYVTLDGKVFKFRYQSYLDLFSLDVPMQLSLSYQLYTAMTFEIPMDSCTYIEDRFLCLPTNRIFVNFADDTGKTTSVRALVVVNIILKAAGKAPKPSSVPHFQHKVQIICAQLFSVIPITMKTPLHKMLSQPSIAMDLKEETDHPLTDLTGKHWAIR